MDAASPDATTPDTGPTVPGDRANPTDHIETGDSGFIGDAPLPDGEGADLGDPATGSGAAAGTESGSRAGTVPATGAAGETRSAGAASPASSSITTATAPRTLQSVPPRGTPRPRLSQSAMQRLRKALLAVATVDGVALALIVGIAIIAVTVTGAGFTPLPATIASMWMLLNLAPFGFGGTDLSLVPAVPAMLLFLAVAWRVRRVVADRIGIQEVRTLAATFIVVPAALTVTAWLMLWDASGVLRINAPDFLQAVASAIVLHGGALIAGFGSRLLRALLRRRKLPEWPLGSLRLAAEYVGWLWAAGVVATVISLVWHHGAVRETMGIADSPGAGAALVLLSLGYLPNVAFGAAGILTGAPANVGVAEAGLFAVTPGTLPPLPTLAAIPQSHLGPFFGVLLVVPVAIALWRVTVYVRTRASERPYAEVVVAGLMVAVFVAVLTLLLGGEVGQYGWSGVSWWFAAVMASVWFVVPGAVAVVALTGVPSRSLADEGTAAAATGAEADDDEAAEDEGADADAAEPEAEAADAGAAEAEVETEAAAADETESEDAVEAEAEADAEVESGADTDDEAEADADSDTEVAGPDAGELADAGTGGEAAEEAGAVEEAEAVDESVIVAGPWAETELAADPAEPVHPTPDTTDTTDTPDPQDSPNTPDAAAAQDSPDTPDAGDDGDADPDVGKQRG